MKTDIKWIVSISIILVAIIAGAVMLNKGVEVANLGEKISESIIIDNGDVKINWNHYETTDIELEKSVSITKSGVYHFTGNLNNGYINIDLNDTDGVAKIILDNVIISNSNGPAIVCSNGEDVVIELVGKNLLSDAKTYDAKYDEDITGTIYSKADLTFTGDGFLKLTANYQDGIVSKDDLKFNGGNYRIVAADDGIRGKDSVYIVDGVFDINSESDAIKSTNETDNGKGFILIEKGEFDITAGAKGVHATNNILIYGGKLSLETYDDAVHSNNYIRITDGHLKISSGDDGVHADKELIIENGTIEIAKSYEGLEAQAITINGGNVSIVASDDGINAGGGSNASVDNRSGAGAFDADTNCAITISGGDVSINASGDGIDSNGYIFFNGGMVIVNGPTNNGNGALDSGAGITMNGGVVIAAGSSGMAESLGVNSSVNNVSIYFGVDQPAGTKVQIKNSAGSAIVDYTSIKPFSHLAIGTDDFILGETYNIYVDDSLYQNFTISTIITTVGNSNTHFDTNQRNDSKQNDMRQGDGTKPQEAPSYRNM